MNTLQNTISRLREITHQTTGTSAVAVQSPSVDYEVDALVSEIERMASEPLFRGRPLDQAPVRIDPSTGVPSFTQTVDLHGADMSGVEILEGRFESTNDQLVGIFEEPRHARARRMEWSQGMLQGIRAELMAAPLSIPITPFSLNRQKHGLYDLNAQIRDVAAADLTAAVTREQILATIHTSMSIQANTLGRIVQALVL